MTRAGIVRILHNERRYPWERTPVESVGRWLSPRGPLYYAIAAYSRLFDAAEAATRPFSSLKERRESVKSYIGMFWQYVRMVKP